VGRDLVLHDKSPFGVYLQRPHVENEKRDPIMNRLLPALEDGRYPDDKRPGTGGQEVVETLTNSQAVADVVFQAISGAPHRVGANPGWWPIPSMRWWPIPSSDRPRSNEWIEAKQTYVANQQSDKWNKGEVDEHGALVRREEATCTCLLQKWSPEDDRRNNYYTALEKLQLRLPQPTKEERPDTSSGTQFQRKLQIKAQIERSPRLKQKQESQPRSDSAFDELEETMYGDIASQVNARHEQLPISAQKKVRQNCEEPRGSEALMEAANEEKRQGDWKAKQKLKKATDKEAARVARVARVAKRKHRSSASSTSPPEHGANTEKLRVQQCDRLKGTEFNLGVFATQLIDPKDGLVLPYKGRIFPSKAEHDTWLQQPENDGYDGQYAIRNQAGLIIDSYEEEFRNCTARYINHDSQRANCEYVEDDNGSVSVCMKTIIPEGAELLADYGEEYAEGFEERRPKRQRRAPVAQSAAAPAPAAALAAAAAPAAAPAAPAAAPAAPATAPAAQALALAKRRGRKPKKKNQQQQQKTRAVLPSLQADDSDNAGVCRSPLVCVCLCVCLSVCPSICSMMICDIRQTHSALQLSSCAGVAFVHDDGRHQQPGRGDAETCVRLPP
jgi:hypothetical protein